MVRSRNVVIVGGGASGLVAAVAAARSGARVRLLERMSRVGRKIPATGAGRCNLTNARLGPEHYHGASDAFVRDVLAQFDLEKTLAFFQGIGLETREEDGGKIFPLSGQASAVLDLLRAEVERLGVQTLCDVRVDRVEPVDAGGFSVHETGGRSWRADRVVIAAGGSSMPNLGSNGYGVRLARALGHRVVEPFPTLVPVELDAPFLKALKGHKVEAAAEIVRDGQVLRGETGEVLFAEYGVSGPPILQLSRLVSEWAVRKEPPAPVLRLDLFPDRPADALRERVRERLRAHPEEEAQSAFVGLLHKRLIPVLLREAGVEKPGTPAGRIPVERADAFAALLKAWEIPCTGTLSWMHAQATAGGVDVKGVDRRTLESKPAPGVFFCGETLDVDGDCGGYNLQWAWSSGHVAGEAAAR